MSAIIVEPEPTQFEQPALPQAEPCVVVIFGATGDLTRRKLMPALCRLREQGCLEGVHVLGVGRNPMSEEEFQGLVRDALDNSKKIPHLDEQQWREITKRLHYMAGELDDQNTYRAVHARLEELISAGASKNRLFYLATPPSLFGTIVKHLGEAGLANEDDDNWSRVVIEKPFGHDLESARALNEVIEQTFPADSIFRIGSISRDEWQASSTRHAVMSLLRDARAMIAGGYRKLLRHRHRR